MPGLRCPLATFFPQSSRWCDVAAVRLSHVQWQVSIKLVICPLKECNDEVTTGRRALRSTLRQLLLDPADSLMQTLQQLLDAKDPGMFLEWQCLSDVACWLLTPALSVAAMCAEGRKGVSGVHHDGLLVR